MQIPQFDMPAATIFSFILPLVGSVFFTLPALWILMRSNREVEQGCVFYFGICCAVLLLIILAFASVNLLGEFILVFFAALTFSVGLFIGWPLQVAKIAGVKLYPQKEPGSLTTGSQIEQDHDGQEHE